MSRGGRPGRGRYVAALLSIAALLSLVPVIVIRGPAADPVDLDANPHFDPTLPLQERVDHVLERMNLDEKVAQLRGLRRMQTPHNRRLGIPDFRPTDGPHGVNRKGGWLWERKTKATAFPVSIALAATWDPALAERVGAAIAREARALDRNWLLAPCVNIVRDPRAGRTQESFGEDPMLAARIGEAFVISEYRSKGSSPRPSTLPATIRRPSARPSMRGSASGLYARSTCLHSRRRSMRVLSP